MLGSTVPCLEQLDDLDSRHDDQDSELFQFFTVLDQCVLKAKPAGFYGGEKELDFPAPTVPLNGPDASAPGGRVSAKSTTLI